MVLSLFAVQFQTSMPDEEEEAQKKANELAKGVSLAAAAGSSASTGIDQTRRYRLALSRDECGWRT